jgi:uncharacterized damage-inducible protein DinB
MPETARIADQLRLAFEGEAWHGPALLEILAGIDAKAAARPIAKAHTIWEITLHIAAWEDVIRRRIGGEALVLSDPENFPAITDASEEAWKKAVDEVRQINERLVRTIAALPDSRLRERVPGKDYDFYFMLHGAVQHVAYHGGQIAILRRMRE